MRIFLFLAMVLFGAAAMATPAMAGAPSPVDKLFDQLKSADNAAAAKPLETQILASFVRSGSASVDLLMSRAEAVLAVGNKDMARKFYDSIIVIAPRYAEAWHRRGLMQADANDNAGAMISLQKAVALNPRHFAAMAELAEMLEDYGQKAEALKLYRQAIALDPQYEGLQRHIDGLTRDVEGQGI